MLYRVCATTPLSLYPRWSRNWKYKILHCLFHSKGPNTTQKPTTNPSAILTKKPIHHMPTKTLAPFIFNVWLYIIYSTIINKWRSTKLVSKKPDALRLCSWVLEGILQSICCSTSSSGSNMSKLTYFAEFDLKVGL